MKLKILILLLIAGIAGASITVVVMRKPDRPQAVQENQWPVAMSNYSKTFKLNTSPPLWPVSKGVTNGHTN